MSRLTWEHGVQIRPIQVAGLVGLWLCFVTGDPALAQFNREEYAARSSQQEQIRLARQAAARAAAGETLVILDTQGIELASIDLSASNVVAWEVSPDARYVAQMRQDPVTMSSDLYVYDVATGDTSRLTESGDGDRVEGFAWSPDSRELAFVALRGSRTQLFRRPVAGGAPGDGELMHTSQAPIGMGHWSPDGRYLTFSPAALSALEGESWVAAIDLEFGGEPLEFMDIDQNILLPRFSPDGSHQVFISIIDSGLRLFAANAAPGADNEPEAWPLALPGDTPVALPGPQSMFWSADGRDFYFCDGDDRMMTVPLDTGDGDYRFEANDPRQATMPEVITARYPDVGCYWQSPDGGHLYFRVMSAPELQQVVVFDRDGVELTRFSEPGFWDVPSFSPDGSRIVALHRNSVAIGAQATFRTFVVASGESVLLSDLEPARQVPTWMPGGEGIAYTSIHFAPPPIYTLVYRSPSNGQGESELLWRSAPSILTAQLVDVSADGSYLAINQGAYLISVPLTAVDPLAREGVDMLRTEFDAGVARFSPDMQYVAFIYDESGRPEVYLAPFDAKTGEGAIHERLQISRDGAAGGLSWRDDGRELYYLSDVRDTAELNDFRVMAVSVDPDQESVSREPQELFEIVLPLSVTSVAPDGAQALWRIASPDGERFVFVLDSSGAP